MDGGLDLPLTYGPFANFGGSLHKSNASYLLLGVSCFSELNPPPPPK